MAETQEHIALGLRHMRAQVKTATSAQAALAAAWKRTMRPGDLDGSSLLFIRYALAVLKAAREVGIVSASEYYSETRRLAGLPPTIPRVGHPDLDVATATEALLVNGPIRVKEALAEGQGLNAAMTAAQIGVLQAGKRLVLEGPRETVIRLSDKDRDAQGWARVSDGSPCFFCAMLLSRGPVYSEESVRFKAHNGCGCQPRPFFRGEADAGWSPDALKFRKIWDDESGGNPALFRSAYNLEVGNTKTRRLTPEKAKAGAYGRKKKPDWIPAATPEDAARQTRSQLTALEDSLVALRARRASGETGLDAGIAWQEKRAEELRAKL